ncbi:MAG: hypothetical protein KGJ42_01860 [Acidobacteriota bacterium]|nr:hypothetical protein [Acidobacteriota bacterium]
MDVSHWLDEPEEHDFPAAAHYLSLVLRPRDVSTIVAQLRVATTLYFAAKDLLRASNLELLERDNVHVRHDLDKVKSGRQLSPVLLVRGDATRGLPLVIADGYHRVCASYWINENTMIPTRLAKLPAPRADASSR